MAPYQKYAPLTEDQSKTFLQLILAKSNGNQSQIEEMGKALEADNYFPYMLLKKRLDCYKDRLDPISMTTDAVVFLAMMGHVPGHWVIMLVECFEKAFEMHKEVIDLEFVATHVYPWGFYTQAGFEEVWDLKKSNHDVGYNWLI